MVFVLGQYNTYCARVTVNSINNVVSQSQLMSVSCVKMVNAKSTCVFRHKYGIRPFDLQSKTLPLSYAPGLSYIKFENHSIILTFANTVWLIHLHNFVVTN